MTMSAMQTTTNQERWETLGLVMRDVAIKAGALTEKMRLAGVTPETKADGSIVTPADRASEALIKEALQSITADYADLLPANTTFVGEESIEAGDKPDVSAGNFFVVDPIDATKNFVHGTPGVDRYTINIALVLDHIPVMGVILEPVSGDLLASKDHSSAIISVAGGPDLPLTPAAGSDDETLPTYRRGAMSYADLIRGKRDEVVHNKSYEWDTAAQDAMLRTVGGSIRVKETGAPLTYGKAQVDFFNPAIISTMDD